jgi:oligopeptide transport system ATP-binding protein
MMAEKEVILSVKNLKQYFVSGHGKNKIIVKAVDDISFDVYKGEVFSLVGESGCGKTTTGRTIIKLYKNTGGQVFFHGQRISANLKEARKMYKSGKITKEEYLKMKRDSKFDRVIDKDAVKRMKELTLDSEELKPFVETYEKEVTEINTKIDEHKALLDKTFAKLQGSNVEGDVKELKQKIKNIKTELKMLQKELKLQDKLLKQDVKDYKYQQIHKNRLLMRKMQMIFQDPIASLNPRMTVKQIIAEGLIINGVRNSKVINQKVKEALRAVGLVEEHASRYPHEFSGGQRQRIGIARALVVDPTFIIADEPISALDVSIRAQVINLLNDLRRDRGITILFIAHDLSVVKYFSDRIAVMYYGRIVEIGDKEKIFRNPLHPYTISLIDAIPLPDPLYEKSRGGLKRYDPATAHNYGDEQPILREVEPDHYVLCDEVEFQKYQKIIADSKK